MKYFYSCIFFCLCTIHVGWSQEEGGEIRGEVVDELSQEPLPFAAVKVLNTSLGAPTDTLGRYTIKGLEPGLHSLEVTYLGYESKRVYDITVTLARVRYVNFELREITEELEGIEVNASRSFLRTEESPLSLKTIGDNEVRRMPGGNRDISTVLRSLPGVASTRSFRNDIIVRGGAPSENVFFIDDIPVPVINHFQTQGSSGGPVGIINVDLLSEARLYTGAFPSSKGNTLSSVMDFQFKEGNKDQWSANVVLGIADGALKLEGPVSKNSSFVGSYRISFLQVLGTILDLPVIPAYQDVQFKYKHRLSQRNHLTLLGIGAYDVFEVNSRLDNDISRRSVLESLPSNKQWNYTIGTKYEHFTTQNSIYSLVLSRNHLNNESKRSAPIHLNDPDDPFATENIDILDYSSYERQNHVRAEAYHVWDNWQMSYGLQYAYSEFFTRTLARAVTSELGLISDNFETTLGIHSLGSFVQGSKRFLGRLTASVGVRVDDNSFLKGGNRTPFLNQLSPRLSLSYILSSKWTLNFNTGIYYQLPPFTTLGYRDRNNNLVNENALYLRSTHYVVGADYKIGIGARVSAETFYKYYDRYLFSLNDGVTLANLGGDFGVVGATNTTSTETGRSYGLEISYQQKYYKGFYFLGSYTLYKSEFSDDNLPGFIPSSWDFGQVISIGGSKLFRLGSKKHSQSQIKRRKALEIGFRWLFAGAAPYTPFDVERSVLIENWDTASGPLIDYSGSLNTERLSPTHQLDVRVDYHLYFRRWSLTLYMDVANVYASSFDAPDELDIVRGDDGTPKVDPLNRDSYIPTSTSEGEGLGIPIPRLGVIFEIF